MRADVSEVFLLRFRLVLDDSRPGQPGRGRRSEVLPEVRKRDHQ
jgi:hypothetical protein